MTRPFPPHFLFGCATSAYQIEGDIENDWSAWERAGRLKDPGTRCGRATDHWNRWREDVDLLARLGAQAYRFSVEWARVEPRPGEFDEAAIARYVEITERLVAHRIEPFVTLLHFTHPPWFHTTCPWHQPDGEAPERFGRFAERVTAALGARVRYYTVINEPSVWLSGAYFKGVIPPGRARLGELAAAATGLIRGHARAHAAIKRANPDAQVGLAKHYMHFSPSRAAHPLDRITTSYVRHHFNHVFVKALIDGVVQLGLLPGVRYVSEVPEAAGTLDFLGVNFYSRVYVELLARFGKDALSVFYEDRDGRGVTDLGWEIHPGGLTEALVDMARYRVPIFITENGIDDRTDSRRAAYIHDHLSAALDAIDRGVDLRGYLHWSLLDNFEWLEGYEPRFGLYRVDYGTLERTLTGGGDYYRRIIQERRLPGERPDGVTKRGTGRTHAG